MLTEGLIKEIMSRFDKIKILPVLGKASYSLMETMYGLELLKICFEFKPEQVLEELKEFIERVKHAETAKEQRYIINFYENRDILFIDITGTLKRQNLNALRLMFKNYLHERYMKLKGVVYIFNNTDEHSSNFQTTWALFRFWQNIGVDYSKVFYLTLSERIAKNIHKYVEPLGVQHAPSMLDIVKAVFPEYSTKAEGELFDIASSLLDNPIKNG